MSSKSEFPLFVLNTVTFAAVCCCTCAKAQTGTATPAPPQVAQRAATVAETSRRYDERFLQGKNAKTALDMVNLLPGFTFSAGDTSARGYSASAGNVLIDGQRPSNKQFTLDTVLQNISIAEVAYIEVIEGARPGLDMLGQTMVANVVMKRGAGNVTILTLGNGFFLDGRYTPSGSLQVTRRGRSGWNFTGAFSASRYVELAEGYGPQSRTDANGSLIQQAEVTSSAGGLSAYTYGVLSMPFFRGNLTLNGSAARTDYAYHEDDMATPVASSSSLKEYLGGPLDGQLLSEIGARYSRSFSEKLKSETVLLVDPNRQTYTSNAVTGGTAQTFAERQHGGEALVRSNLRYAAADTVTVEGSAELAYNWLSTQSEYKYAGSAVTLPNALASVNEKRGQVNTHLAWTARKNLDLDVGAQVELSNISANADTRQSRFMSYFKPKFAANYSASSASRVGIRIEREVGQLNFTNFVAVSSLSTGSIRAGNTNIVPQQDWVAEGSFERHLWTEGDLAVTYRHYWIADAIDRVPIDLGSGTSGIFDAPGNIGSGKEDTLIVNATLPVRLPGVSRGQLRATATRLWSRVTDPTTHTDRAITGLDPLEYSLSFRDDLPAWKADWGVSFFTPCSSSNTIKGCTQAQFRFNEVDSYRATPTVNVFAEYLPLKRLSLRLEADNVFEQRYTRVVRIFGGPLNVSPLLYQEKRSLTSSASFVISVRELF